MKFSVVKSKWFCFLLLINVIFGVMLSRVLLEYSQLEQSEKERVIGLTQKAADELGKIVERVEKQAQKMADTFSTHQNLSPDAIEKQLSDELNSNTDLLGSSVLYGPYAYRKDKYLFGPYIHIKNGKREFVDVGSVYDYTKKDISNFFYSPFHENKAIWMDPFWGKASSALILTYSVPFYSNVNKEIPTGVVVLSISLDKIREIIERLDVGTNGFSALTTQNGKYIYYPNSEYVTGMRNLANVAEEANDKDRVFVAQQAKKLKGGMIEHVSVSTHKPAWLVWEPVRSSGWSLQVTFLKEDLFDENIMKQKQIKILVGTIIFLVVLCALLLQAVPADAHKKQWIFSAVSSLLLLSGIGFIWKSYLDHYRLVREDVKEITSYRAVEDMKKESEEFYANHNLQGTIFLPTGIYVETIKFINQNEIELTGYVWQKYEKGKHDELSRGITFIRASQSKITEVLRLQQDNQEVIRWSFSASIKQSIDYSKYPIDHAGVFLKMAHKDLNHNVILVPDFESYTMVIPILKPGIDSRTFVAGWTITSSKFVFQEKFRDTSFGIEKNTPKEFKMLVFFVSMKRVFVNAFISNLVPLIVVYVMLFAFIFIEIDAKSLLTTCSGTFFAIILMHSNTRKEIAVYDIFYLEYFYIITYFILTFLVVASIIFHRNNQLNKDKLLSIGRLLYWPVVSSSFFVITAIIFYR